MTLMIQTGKRLVAAQAHGILNLQRTAVKSRFLNFDGRVKPFTDWAWSSCSEKRLRINNLKFNLPLFPWFHILSIGTFYPRLHILRNSSCLCVEPRWVLASEAHSEKEL